MQHLAGGDIGFCPLVIGATHFQRSGDVGMAVSEMKMVMYWALPMREEHIDRIFGEVPTESTRSRGRRSRKYLSVRPVRWERAHTEYARTRRRQTEDDPSTHRAYQTRTVENASVENASDDRPTVTIRLPGQRRRAPAGPVQEEI
jgi:hypothetical protein